jgi:glycosyltransferase involved in cell wall biosynthesis
MPNRANITAPVTLLGAPRSGTTLVAELFRSHSTFHPISVGETANLLFGTWQAIAFARGVTRPTERHRRILTSDERAAIGVQDLFLGLFPDRSPRWVHKPIGLPKAASEQFGDTEWDTAAEWYWHVLASSFPNSTTAIILRNPWDVIASQRARFGFSEENLWWSYSYLTHILAHGKRPTAHVVRYERLTADKEAETRRLFEHLGVEFEPDVMSAHDLQHVPNNTATDTTDLVGPTVEQRKLISAGYERLGESLDWPDMGARQTRVAPGSARPTDEDELREEIARLERSAERRVLDAADERYRLWTEVAHWRKIVHTNRALLDLDKDLELELDRQLDAAAQARATAEHREAYIRSLEDELDRVYGSKTWRAATHFFHARNQYRHDSRVAGAKAFFAPPVVRARVQDFRDRQLPKEPIAPPTITANRARGISLVLPSGITLGGVTSWAIEMAGNVAERHRAVLVQHEDTGPPISTEPSARVEVMPATSPAVPGPRGAERLAHEYAAALPAVFVPNYNYAGYAMLAELSGEHGDQIRVVGMAHTDQLHYYALLTYYEPVIHTFVAVSQEIASNLERLLPTERHADIVVMPYGVHIPEIEHREKVADDQPLRLVYAGRLEKEQKRVVRLVDLADRLAAAGVNFTLDIVGDGDEEAALRAALSNLPDAARERVTMHRAVRPDEMPGLWQGHDICVLVSAYEGTSIAMLEAMANGCVPVVTSVSGTRAVISDSSVGVTCELDDLDDMVRELKALDDDRDRLQTMARDARIKVAEEYGFQDHAHAFEDLCLATWTAESRTWPPDRPVVPTDRFAFEAGVERRVNR